MQNGFLEINALVSRQVYTCILISIAKHDYTGRGPLAAIKVIS
jgi:hypothetical protein